MDQEILSYLDQLTRAEALYVFFVVLCSLTAGYAVRLLFGRLEVRARETGYYWDDAFLRSARQPASFLIWLMGISWGAQVLITDSANAFYGGISAIRYLGTILLIWIFLNRFIRECEGHFTRQDVDRATVEALSKLLRVSIAITLALMMLQTLGVSISGVLAFGGIGGIAVGFAAKDLLANFFGGLMLYLDRPFVVGDWIRSPDQEIEGNVERIGWRLTIIRTFDKRPLYIPNATFNNISVENPSRMTNRRIYETIGIRYQDAGKMGDIVADVRNMLENHPDIDTRQTLIVNFNAFAASSMDFFIYTFTKTTNWIEFHAVKQLVLLEVLAIIEGHGAECAFPTSTVFLEPDEGVRPEPPFSG